MGKALRHSEGDSPRTFFFFFLVGSYARCHLVLSSTQHATNTPTSTIQNRVC